MKLCIHGVEKVFIRNLKMDIILTSFINVYMVLVTFISLNFILCHLLFRVWVHLKPKKDSNLWMAFRNLNIITEL